MKKNTINNANQKTTTDSHITNIKLLLSAKLYRAA